MKSVPTEETQNDARLVAAIDIGSNSLRMAIAQLHPDGAMDVLERTRQPLRLGHDTFLDGRLQQQTINAATRVMRDYRRILDSYQVEVVRAIATSAVREAANRDVFVDRVARATDIEVEVIEPTEESRLLVSAVRQDVGRLISLSSERALITEVGGGSTLFTILEGGQISASQSSNLGSVRMQEIFSTARELPKRAAELLQYHVEKSIEMVSKSLGLSKVKTFAAIGGDARFAAHQVGEPVPDTSLYEVRRKRLAQFVRSLYPLSPEEIVRKYRIPFADAETLVPGLIVYAALLDAVDASEMLVSQVSMRDGILQDFPRYLTGQPDPALAEGILLSARTLAARFGCDPKHGDQVADIATRLFDALQKEHGMQPWHRLLLRVAALLHDMGTYINPRSHHKHSAYLISNSEIFGLGMDDVRILSQVARYHRGSVPKSSHVEYTTLRREQRMVINKLAAILRVADALDRGHWQQVSDFTIERRNGDLVLYIQGAPDLTLERRALVKKGDLFEEVFGMRVRVEQERAQPVVTMRQEDME